jgi:hypothetical protein
MLQAERIVRELLSAADKFMRIHKTDSAVLIVSPETFAEISPSLSDIKHDKSYSSGHLGKHYVKSDPFIAHGNKMIVYKPIELEDMLRLRAEDYLPAFTDPEVEKLRKHMENAKKKEVK